MTITHRLVQACGSVLVCLLTVADSGAAQSESLGTVADQFAEAWAKGSAASMAPTLRTTGVIIELQGENHGSLDPARAVSAIDRFLRGHVTRTAEVSRASDVGGSPKKGFAEIRWQAAARGTTEVLTYTVFVGLMMDDGTWRVSEVRVLR